ncbi:hypothetical protein [Virgibacillus sp. YIM 98842]|uniref:hypothetical protein n=1 Tax=Virgibacillus sp. YIM 98842 TaxID=2663533 RepID=UPI0013D9D57F|nr:hypothetical protein [Virgibacillus sp. YIM 98842]
MKLKIVLSVFILFLLGGCNVLGQKDIAEMDPADLPDVIAFQDDFTREFMSSLEEVEDGYYLFESKTGGYTMMYPQNAKMDQGYFEKSGETFEAIRYGEDESSNDFLYYTTFTFDEGERTEEPENLLKLLSSSVNYDGDYEEMKYNDKTIYFATMQFVTDTGTNSTDRFFGLVKSKTSSQAVSFTYNVITENNDIDYESDLHEASDVVMKLIQSIEFNMNE